MPLFTRAGRFLGAIRDDSDARDYRYIPPARATLPPNIDLAPYLPETWHQGTIGSCTANAGAALIAWLYPGYRASRLALYYYARYLENTLAIDNGVMLRSVMKTLANIGAWSEDEWPYEQDNFAVAPPPSVLAGSHNIVRYARLTSDHEMLSCLAEWMPFLFAIELPDFFDDADIAGHGILRMPTSRMNNLGRHCMAAVGYEMNFKQHPDFLASGVDPALVTDVAVKARNSWGRWGLDGHCWIPMPYVANPSTGGDAWLGHKLVSHISEPGGPMVGGIKIEGQFTKGTNT